MKPFNVFPYGSKINFMRLRWVSISLAALLAVAAVVGIAIKGFNFALDFTGGTATELVFEKPVDVEQARAKLQAAGMDDAQVQTFGNGQEILVRMQTAGETQGAGPSTQHTADRVLKTLNTAENPARILSSEFVGPQVGKDLAQNGVWALLFVVVGFLIYISFRFEKKFAIAAVLTTLHDVLICLGWFAWTQHEFDLTVLAGVLSVMGFSINDTIVVFDRVRENFRTMRANPEQVLNASINQTLSRTVITSFVAFLSCFALYMYGGQSMRGMSEAQMIGIIIGTLSSIFIACPLLTMSFLRVTQEDLMPKESYDAELARRP